MSDRWPLLIPGAATRDEPLEVYAPFDRTLLATVETADRAAVDHALETAHALFRDKDAWLPAAERIEILRRAADLVAERAEVLALEAAREGGKPLLDSRVEVARAVDGLRACVEVMRTDHGQEVPMGLNAASAGHVAFTRREPIGVVVAFSAFNHPLNLIVHQAATAIAAGCPVIVKPAETTPLTCFRLVKILHEAGLPPAWCQALAVSDLAVAGHLAADARLGYFSFIGHADVGWTLRSRLAPGVRCAFEHGGAAPVIVAEDVDLTEVVPALAKGGLYHAGQVCVSVQRVFVEQSIAEAFAKALAERANAMVVGDPTAAETEVGPLIRPQAVKRVTEWVAEAAAGGGRILCGGQALSETCYAPTVIFDPPAQAKVSCQEVFGPVVNVYPYTDLNDAIGRANELPHVFQAAIFTHDLDRALRAYRRLDASAVMVNQHTAFRVDWMPFGGLRHSGLGVGGIAYGMREMQVEKLLVLRSPEL